MKNRSPLLPLLVSLLSVLLIGPVPAAWAEDSSASPSPSSASEEQGETDRGAPLMVVLDGSDSMLQKDVEGDNITRLDAVKESARSILRDLPSSARAGLMTFGTKKSPSEEGACDDISVLSPVAPVDRTKLSDAVNTIDAKGVTPIGRAMKKAAEELSQDGPQAIVVLSDGEDTCSPPPCDVAKELKASGTDVSVHAVGLHVSDQAREELKCVAETTGGTYADANNTETISSTLRAATMAALKGYEASGTPINGARDELDATEMTPGRYLDSIDGRSGYDDTTAKYYKLHVEDGNYPVVSASVVLPNSETTKIHSISVTLTDPDNSSCMVTDSAGGMTTSGGDVPTTAVASGATEKADDQDSECFTGGDYIVKLQRESTDKKANRAPLPVEISAMTVTDPDSYQAPSDHTSQDFLDRSQDKPVPVQGGSTFSAATELTDHHIRGTMYSGETQYFAVRVHEGEQLRVRADLVPGGSKLDEIVGTRLWVLDPARRTTYNVESSSDQSSADETPSTSFSGGALATHSSVLRMNMAAPVAASNAGDSNYGSLSIPGDYYIAVAGHPNSPSGRGQEIKYNLVWDKKGEATSEEIPQGAAVKDLGNTDSGDGQDQDASQKQNGSGNGEQNSRDQDSTQGDAQATDQKPSGLFGLSAMGIILIGVAAVLLLGGLITAVILLANRSSNRS